MIARHLKSDGPSLIRKEKTMAVPKRRTSVTRKRKRRSHLSLQAPNLDKCPRCLEPKEPHDVHEILELARPYLPWEGALGEMVMSVGKAVYLQRMGADGVIDVSPFGCMNGIVSEAVYPKLSRENGGIPIRNFYVDRATSRLEDGLEIFLELARNYRARRTRAGAESCRAGAL